MYRKMLSTIFSFTILITLISILITTIILYFFFSGQLENELKNEMGFLKPGVELEGEKYLKEVSVPDRVTLISKDGEVIYDNYRSTPLENHIDRTEVKEALNNGVGSAVRYSNTLNEKTYYYAIRLTNGDIIRISKDQASLFRIVTGFTQVYLLIIIGALIISFFISKKVVKSVTDSVGEVDPEHPLANASYPELIPLLHKIDDQNKLIRQKIKEVNQKKADFETITANMNEGIIMTDQHGLVNTVNTSARILLGDENIKSGDSIYKHVNNTKFSQLIDEALLGSKESLVLNTSGKTLSIIASPIKVLEKQTGLILIIIDITERAQMERLRSEYIANVSHELKTPLTSISGFAEIMNNGLVKQEDISHFAGKIYDEAQHLIGMVNNILTIGYLDENKNNVIKTDINLKTIAGNVINRLEVKARDRDITIKLVSRGDPVIQGNNEVLLELLYNLVDNAIKYNKENGKVVVFINGEEKNQVTIKVSDSGIGIPVSERERIFERFYRPDKSRSNKKNGTGLGLSIVKHAALIHNAEVSVLSVLDKGSTFIIDLPRIS